MNSNKHITAVIWDYDGTLVDTRLKNLNVTQKILQALTGKHPADFPALRSVEDYTRANSSAANWRELYKREFGLSETQIDEAGGMWTEYQLRDRTPTPFFDGISEVLSQLGALPQGIFSQNSQASISHALRGAGLSTHFRSIIGYEEVDIRKQKPDPAGLLMCLKDLGGPAQGLVFYIGDHETDAKCALNANRVFSERGLDIKVISITALYGSWEDDANWSIKANYRAASPGDIADIISGF